MAEAKKRYAVVTGSNKGIGYEMCRQLASSGITVVLTARDEKKGLEAAQELKKCVPSDNVFFHQLDVADPASIASFADFIKARFGKLDILINNAGVPGVVTDPDAFRDAFTKLMQTGEGINWDNIIKAETYELAEECVDINYHGMKRMCEALLPLLQLSDSPRIINASSSSGKLQNVTHEWAKGVLSDADNLTEEKIDEVLSAFLKDFKDGVFKAKGWPPYTSAYIMSKSSLNAYTRVLAKKYPNISVNCVDPGFVKTELSHYIGPVSVEQGAAGAVKLALLPDGCPSGLLFAGTEETPF